MSSPPPQSGPEVYAAVAARRTQFDNLLWQVPTLNLTAQAFVFTVALGGDTSRLGRIIACLISLLMTFLTLHLFTRHRQAEILDAHWLADYEKEHSGAAFAHGPAWRASRNAMTADAWIFEPLAKLPGYRTWAVGLSGFGLIALVVLVISIFWPGLLAVPS